MSQEPEHSSEPVSQPAPEDEFKIIDFGRILRHMVFALLALAALGGLVILVTYLIVNWQSIMN